MITFSRLGNHGRLGNQLFQIAVAVSSAIDNNDTYIFPKWEYEEKFKGPFNIDYSGKLLANSFIEYRQDGFHYNPIQYDHDLHLDLIGYFQSEQYFSKNSQLVRDLFTITVDSFTPKPDEMTCSIHFRHGDTFDRSVGGGHVGNEGYHPMMTAAYYRGAIERAVSLGARKFLIFYDHPLTKEWIMNNQLLSGLEFTFVENQTNVQDMRSMSCCDFNIIANSSFSWWAAWLNVSKHKQVICPLEYQWFGPKYRHYIMKDLLPKEWIKCPQ